MEDTLVATNAFATLTIQNLVHDNKVSDPDTTIPIALSKRQPPLDLVTPWLRPYLPLATLPEPPVRQPATLPPSLDLNLNVRLGKCLAVGRSGVIFELEIEPHAGYPADKTLPQLVAKVARPNRAASLAREAWFYDEMAVIQGSVIPLCYGWFDLQPRHDQSMPLLQSCIPPRRRWGASPEEEEPIGGWNATHLVLQELREDPNRLSVLIIERLGSHLYPGKNGLDSPPYEELCAILREVSDLGVGLIPEIRWENVMHKFPGTPSRPSFHHKVDHRFRLIDFEVAYKTNQATRRLYLAQIDDAERICMALDDGCYDSDDFDDGDSCDATDEDENTDHNHEDSLPSRSPDIYSQDRQ
ncbi:hypothetical protein PENSPDRAFT_736347 [Peniophora sp. CONT]|nr:hypothetical protein PENSPDRAFT_736347 [Peniophora sp. CONT]